MVACNAIVIDEEDSSSLNGLENGGGTSSSRSEHDEPSRIGDQTTDAPSNDASQGEIQRYIRHLSTSLTNPEEVNVDEQLLENVLRQAGEFSYGICAIEVYSFEDPRLVPVGSWFDKNKVMELNDQDGILQPEICIPGVDLVGDLWQHSSGMKRASSFSSLVKNRSWSASFRQKMDNEKKISLPQPPFSGGLNWRELKSVIKDPDEIHGPRLEALHDIVGIERATGISFDSHGIKGMVVFYSKETVDVDLLSTVANEMYLRRTASSIGSILAMAESRRASVSYQRQKQSYLFTVHTNVENTPEDHTAAKAKRFSHVYCGNARDRAKAWVKKLRGGGSQIPPGMPFVETLWTMAGVFIGLLTVSSINMLFQTVTEQEFDLMGPFGALMTLQYGLTAAPAAQPRSIVLGHTVALAISMAFTYIPDSILPVWIRQLVAPAFAIGAMVKLGITHPPAGAFSVIFAQGNHNWGFYGVAVLSSAVSIIPAVMINNLSQRRMYPSYWGYLPSAVVQKVREVRGTRQE
jgi:hypothetical protein